jgi:hypothetical protein
MINGKYTSGTRHFQATKRYYKILVENIIDIENINQFWLIIYLYP